MTLLQLWVGLLLASSTGSYLIVVRVKLGHSADRSARSRIRL